MSYSQLQKMDPEVYRDRFLDELWDVVDDPQYPFFFLKECEGHGNIHYAKTEDELLYRVLHANILAASCFSSPEVARDYIAFAMINGAEDITNWFFSKKWEKGEKEYSKLELVQDMRDTPNVGYGIDNHLQKKGTGAIRIVLERDFSPQAQFGIKLITAFPELTRKPECTVDIGEPLNIDDVIRNRPIFADPIDRLTVLCKYRYPHLGAYYGKDRERNPVMAYHHPCGDGIIDVYIQQKNAKIRQRVPGNSRKLEMSEYVFAFPKEGREFLEIVSARDAILKEKKKELKNVGEWGRE